MPQINSRTWADFLASLRTIPQGALRRSPRTRTVVFQTSPLTSHMQTPFSFFLLKERSHSWLWQVWRRSSSPTACWHSWSCPVLFSCTWTDFSSQLQNGDLGEWSWLLSITSKSTTAWPLDFLLSTNLPNKRNVPSQRCYNAKLQTRRKPNKPEGFLIKPHALSSCCIFQKCLQFLPDTNSTLLWHFSLETSTAETNGI